MAVRPPKFVAHESLLRQTTRLRVVGVEWVGDPLGDLVWGEVTGAALPAAIELLAARLQTFEEDDGEEEWEYECACEPACFYELYDGPRRLAVIAFHGAGHMMLRGVAAIFNFDQGDVIEHWLAARGITDPRFGQ